ncbi:hypothetical protein SAMN05660841_01287 [Sphingobacterium nematocida]|uniref:Uncharacterized protein n=1 Tax=Sphingobacterium nematocida TaxID=1513896 RepID=A0A1T5CB31_9SPHI|nr:hypothetical protein [Sphingobacterium nematocida]SKB56658.1 hypothetical protein SAMN05660841_01287 [Sphingobacterium nematocida]
MGIRYEKDTILNWINEMGKFLRLVVGQWKGLEEDTPPVDINKGYEEFFQHDRAYFIALSEKELIDYSMQLEQEQVRPLAQLLMYDGLIHKDSAQLSKAKALFEYYMRHTGSFSFEDYGFLNEIDKHLN